LLVFLDATHDNLYLHCEECEWGWRDPVAAAAGDLKASFLTLLEHFESEPATGEEIERRGWKRYVAGEFKA